MVAIIFLLAAVCMRLNPFHLLSEQGTKDLLHYSVHDVSFASFLKAEFSFHVKHFLFLLENL